MPTNQPLPSRVSAAGRRIPRPTPLAALAVAIAASLTISSAHAADDSHLGDWQPVRDAAPARRNVDDARIQTGPRSSANRSGRRGDTVRQVQHQVIDSSVLGETIIEGGPLPYADGEVIIDGGHYPGPQYGVPQYGGPVGGGFVISSDPVCGCEGPVCDGGCDGCATACGPSCGGCGRCNGHPLAGELNDRDFRHGISFVFPQDGWFSAEYLLWNQDGMRLPPLVSTGVLPSRVTPGNPGRVLFGGDEVLDNSLDGVRIDFGVWLDKCHTVGIGAEYFNVGPSNERFFADQDDFAELDRPFFNVAANREDTELVAFPNRLSGSVAVDVRSELTGWGVHLRKLSCVTEGCRRFLLDACPQPYSARTEYLLGFRSVQLQEGVRIEENLIGINPVARFNLVDEFAADNHFNGLDVGILHRITRGDRYFSAGLRLAVGNTNQDIFINGSTAIDGTARQVGGLLAQPSNIGSYEFDEFSILPQLDLKYGYYLTERLAATIGYTFLYWSNVARPGDQIDRLVDPGQLPTNPATVPAVAGDFPQFRLDQTDYWAQGVNFGLAYRW